MNLVNLLVNLLVLLLVLGVFFLIARLIAQHMGLPPLFMTIVQVVLALVLLVWLLSLLGYGGLWVPLR